MWVILCLWFLVGLSAGQDDDVIGEHDAITVLSEVSKVGVPSDGTVRSGLTLADMPPDLNLKLCNRFSPDVSECLAKAVEDAIGKLATGCSFLGTPPIDPFVFNEPIVLAPGKWHAKFPMTYTNLVVRGLSKSNVVNVDVSQLNTDNLIRVITTTPQVNISGFYNISRDGQDPNYLLPQMYTGKFNMTVCDVIITHQINGNGADMLVDEAYVYEVRFASPEGKDLEITEPFATDPSLNSTLTDALDSMKLLLFFEMEPTVSNLITYPIDRLAERVFSIFPLDVLLPSAPPTAPSQPAEGGNAEDDKQIQDDGEVTVVVDVKTETGDDMKIETADDLETKTGRAEEVKAEGDPSAEKVLPTPLEQKDTLLMMHQCRILRYP